MGQWYSKIPIWSLGLQQDWVRWSEFSYGNSEGFGVNFLIRQHGLMFRLSPLVFLASGGQGLVLSRYTPMKHNNLITTINQFNDVCIKFLSSSKMHD